MAIRVALAALGLLGLSLALAPAASFGGEKIGNITTVEGMRDVQLVGFGLVVGLDGTGDKGLATAQTIANMLQRMGITVKKPRDIRAKNSAAVMVTAVIPPYAKVGFKTDALVSTIADAKSLQGGTLLITPLKGPDGKVYALAQGPVSIGGFIGGAGGNRVEKNHQTSGAVPGGVMVERDVPFVFDPARGITLLLERPDFRTATAIAGLINRIDSAARAKVLDPMTVRFDVPDRYKDRVAEFVDMVQELEVDVEVPPVVVINERTGTVVIGNDVRIRPVAIAHGSLTIEIKTFQDIVQPPPFAPESAETVVVPQRDVGVEEKSVALTEVSGVTLGEVVKALNALGVTPRDLISILQSLKAAGALRAELKII